MVVCSYDHVSKCVLDVVDDDDDAVVVVVVVVVYECPYSILSVSVGARCCCMQLAVDVLHVACVCTCPGE